MGMADVFVKRNTKFIVPALAYLWAVDHLVGWYAIGRYGLGISAIALLVICFASVALFPGLWRTGMNGCALAFFVASLGPAQSTETVAFLFTVLLAKNLDAGRPLWGAAFLGAGIYMFAGLNKASSEAWLGGLVYVPEAIQSTEFAWVYVYGAIIIEILLAFALIARLRLAVGGVIVFHSFIVLIVSSDLHHGFSLAIYGALMATLATWGCPVRLRDLRDYWFVEKS